VNDVKPHRRKGSPAHMDEWFHQTGLCRDSIAA
jgi:hypothetical protein